MRARASAASAAASAGVHGTRSASASSGASTARPRSVAAVQPGLRQGEIRLLAKQPRAARRDVGLLEQPVGVGEHGGRAGGSGQPGGAVQQVGLRAGLLRGG